jgi:phosphate transport system substrate-binding protein
MSRYRNISKRYRNQYIFTKELSLKKFIVSAVSLIALAGCQDKAGGPGASRDYVFAVGSSTVYPFATAAAEAFKAAAASGKTPKIESTGTGGGVERFCQGVGSEHPDIVNASRALKKSEFDTCVKNGVKDIMEIQIGFDGLAIGESVNGPKFALTQEDIYKALAATPYGKPNTAKTWKDVNPALPAVAISVFGPPSTSGTYDSLKEIFLEKGCDKNPEMKALKEKNKDEHKKICTSIRSAPEYVEQGENDNLIIQKLDKNPTSVGVFGYSFLDSNRTKIRDIPINGSSASYETIAAGSYPGARPLFIYVKKAHIGVIPGLKEYVAEMMKGAEAGGYLSKKGLITAMPETVAVNGKVLADLTTIDGSNLK